jgi:hypothetical protein
MAEATHQSPITIGVTKLDINAVVSCMSVRQESWLPRAAWSGELATLKWILMTARQTRFLECVSAGDASAGRHVAVLPARYPSCHCQARVACIAH